jgi:hypothetical protein
MPLSPPAARDHLHTRNIDMRGYRRADGLWDIEGHLTDVKSYAFDNEWRGTIAPGVPIHDMWVRLTIDDAMTVQDIEVTTDASPFRICGDVAPNFDAVKGLTIGPGWTRRIKQVLGGRKGCTHLVEMIGALATVAYQTRARERGASPAESADAPARRPAFLNSCHALASDGEVVKRFWPAFYDGAVDDDQS